MNQNINNKKDENKLYVHEDAAPTHGKQLKSKAKDPCGLCIYMNDSYIIYCLDCSEGVENAIIGPKATPERILEASGKHGYDKDLPKLCIRLHGAAYAVHLRTMKKCMKNGEFAELGINGMFSFNSSDLFVLFVFRFQVFHSQIFKKMISK